MATHIKLGQLVYSMMGRDRGRHYVVIGQENDRRLHLTDGRYRPVDQPKAKNIAHVQPIDCVAHDISERLLSGHAVTDEQVRAALGSLCNDQPRKEGD